MMTELEVRLSEADPAYAKQLQEELEQACGECKRELMRGGPPEPYRQLELKARALEAAISILHTIKRG